MGAKVMEVWDSTKSVLFGWVTDMPGEVYSSYWNRSSRAAVVSARSSAINMEHPYNFTEYDKKAHSEGKEFHIELTPVSNDYDEAPFTSQDKIVENVYFKDNHIKEVYFDIQALNPKKKKICWLDYVFLTVVFYYNGTKYHLYYQPGSDVSGAIKFDDGSELLFNKQSQIASALIDKGIISDEQVVITDNKEAYNLAKPGVGYALIYYDGGPYVTRTLQEPERSWKTRNRKTYYVPTSVDKTLEDILQNFDAKKICEEIYNITRRKSKNG